MNMPAPLTIAARRAMVEELRRREPDISARKMAARLGVGKDAILRDLDANATANRQPEPAAPPAEPETAPPPAPEADRLVLVVDEPLRQALAVLRARVDAPDTPSANARVARAALRAMVDTILEESP